MVAQRTLFEEVTRIAEDYFGPAAPRVMSRLITNHLRKSPDKLRDKDMPELTKWTRMAVSVITEDTAVIEEFVGRMKAVAAKSSKNQ